QHLCVSGAPRRLYPRIPRATCPSSRRSWPHGYHFRIVSECFGNVYSKPFPLVLTEALRVTGRTTLSLPNVCVALRVGLFSSHTLTGPARAPATVSTRA